MCSELGIAQLINSNSLLVCLRPPPVCAEDALLIFEQGASSPEAHIPLLTAWGQLAEQMGRRQVAADVRRRLKEAGRGGRRQ